MSPDRNIDYCDFIYGFHINKNIRILFSAFCMHRGNQRERTQKITQRILLIACLFVSLVFMLSTSTTRRQYISNCFTNVVYIFASAKKPLCLYVVCGLISLCGFCGSSNDVHNTFIVSGLESDTLLANLYLKVFKYLRVYKNAANVVSCLWFGVMCVCGKMQSSFVLFSFPCL